MRFDWNEHVHPFIQRWFFAPFSNKVTKLLLYTGMTIIAAPLAEHLIVNVVLKKVFDFDLPIDVPDVPAYIAGGSLMVIGALHNLLYLHLENSKQKRLQETSKEKKEKKEPHDQKIIEELIYLLPYDNTHNWIGRASSAGLRRDFTHDLDRCMSFSEPPYKLYNEKAESKKQELVAVVRNFSEKCLGYLGGQEDKSGEMYLPPYQWKGMGVESEEKYYEMRHEVAESGQALLKKYNEFIEWVKSEGFILQKKY